MEKNYYPLSTEIIDDDPESYNVLAANGDIICMYVYKDLAKQIVDAYNEKYKPNNEGHEYADLQRWNQNPLWKQLDVEKVIENLYYHCKSLSYMINKQNDPATKDVQNYLDSVETAIQNAEAAIGMLQAFNDKRGHIGPELQKIISVKIPTLKDGKPQKITPEEITPLQKDVLRREIASILPNELGKYSTATAIIYAIEEVLKLRNL